MKTPNSLFPIAWVLAATVLTGCASHSFDYSRSIQAGIASALASSSLGPGTKSGCLNSLELWSTETTAPTPRNVSSGLFFLGDSYLVYDFEYLVVDDADSFIVVQSGDSTRRVRVNPSQALELSRLVSAAQSDPSPRLPSGAVHTTCVVFLDTAGNYFPVYPDEADDSIRHTDKAIELLGQINEGAP